MSILLLVAQAVYAQQQEQSRKMVTVVVESGNIAYEVSVDANPPWRYRTMRIQGYPVFVAHTPKGYSPLATVNIRFFPGMGVKASKMKAFSRGAIDSALQNYNAQSTPELAPAHYGRLEGYQVTFRGRVTGKPRAVRIFIARNSKGDVMTLSVFTLPDKISHVMPAVERIWESIRFRKP